MKTSRSRFRLAFVNALLAIVLTAVPLVNADQPAERKLRLITIGSGGVNGVYYPAAGALCRLLNRRTDQHKIRCLAETSGGSVQNVLDIGAGAVDFGLVQTDIQSDAILGARQFSKQGAVSSLRSLFSVHAEPFTIVSRLDSGLTHFRDLKGKRVSLDGPGSGSRSTTDLVLKAFEMTESDFAEVFTLSVHSATVALCENKIDAFVLVVGHPNDAVRDVSETCAVRLIEVTGEPIQGLLREHQYFLPMTINGGIYSGNQKAVQTFGVRASVVSLETMDSEIAYQLTRTAFENLDDLRLLHPAFAELKRSDMITGNTAPLHKGAIRYFEQSKPR